MGDDCFFCGCGGSAGSTSVVHDAGPTEPETEAEVETEPEAPGGAVAVPQPRPPVLIGEATIEGELQALIAGQNGCYAVTKRAGYYVVGSGSVPDAVVLGPIDENGVVGETASLPEPVRRSYGKGARVSEDVAIPYASTPGWRDQDGTQQGVVVLDTSGALLADHDLAAHGLVYPGAVLPEGVGFVVIGSAGATSQPGNRIDFNAVAALRVAHRRDPNSVSLVRTYDGFKNGGAAAIAGGQILIAAPDNSFALESDARSTLLVVDQDTLELTGDGIREGALVRGVGLNGQAPVRNGRILFAGAAADLSGRAINLVDATTLEVEPLQLPDEIAVTDVPGGEFAGRQPTLVEAVFAEGGGILLSLNQRRIGTGTGGPVMESRTYFFNPADGNLSLLNARPADFPIPPVEYADGRYCTGESGTATDGDGNKLSEVRFWSNE